MKSQETPNINSAEQKARDQEIIELLQENNQDINNATATILDKLDRKADNFIGAYNNLLAVIYAGLEMLHRDQYLSKERYDQYQTIQAILKVKLEDVQSKYGGNLPPKKEFDKLISFLENFRVSQ